MIYRSLIDTIGREVKLSCVVEIIKGDSLKEHTDYLRGEKDKKKRQAYKGKHDKEIGLVVLQGTFKKREKIGIKETSEIAGFDIDLYGDEQETARVKKDICKLPFVVLCFVSPSGGLKVFVRIPKIKDDLEYKTYWNAIALKLKKYSPKDDESCKDVCRLCFLSYDPLVYVNYNAEVFIEKVGEVIEAPVVKEETTTKEIPQQKDIPSYCPVIETHLCKVEFPSGSKTRHAYTDGNAYIYSKANNKPEVLEQYKKEQGRQNSAFNDASTWEWSCGSIITYLNANKTNPVVKKAIIDCEDICIYNKMHEKFELPTVLLPQQSHVLASKFVSSISELLRDKDIFYRKGDDSVVEVRQGLLKIVKPTRMITLLESVCVPGIQVFTKLGMVFHKRSATEQTCKILLSSPTLHNSLRQIEKTLNAPIPFLKDGKLYIPKRKYNSELKLYLNEDSPEITRPDMKLEEAKKILYELYKEFCFKEDVDGMRALMGLITPFCRGLYKNWYTRTPVFIFMANRERAGKDCCAGIRTITFEGHAIEEPPISTGIKGSSQNDELRKKILSGIMAGKGFLHFANNKGFINNSVFEQVITASTWSDRLLGSNNIATFGNDLEFSLSGNLGTTMTPDLANRGINIELFLGIENANDRKFNNPNLHEYVSENRGLILSALYSLVRNWYDNGMLRSKIVFSSFPEWAAICGGIMEAAGYENPLKHDSGKAITLDRELEEMKVLFDFMYDKCPSKFIKKNEVRKKITTERDNEDSEYSEIFSYFDLDERADQTKFGKILERYFGRELSGITLVVDETTKTKHKQKIKFTKENVKKELTLFETFGVENESG